MRILFFLLLFFSMHLHAAMPATAVWEIRTGGSSNNGGGFDSAKGGTDYSQQNSSQFNNTDLASTSGTTNPCVVTSASHNFVSTDVGNMIHVTAGTSWTTGIYEIVSAAGNAATLDRACGSAASISGGTWFEGGAYALGNAFDSTFLGSNMAAGNIVWIKNDGSVHSTTTNDSPTVGTTTVLSQINGYQTTRGDNPTGSNRPTLNMNSANLVIGYTIVRNLFIKGAAASMFQMGVGSIINNVKVNNTTSNGSGRNAVNCTQDCQIFNSELISWGGNAINVASASHATLVGNYIHDSATCVNLAAGTSSMLWMVHNVVAGCTSTGLNITSALNFSPALVVNNTFYGFETPVSGTVAIKMVTGASQINILDNIIYGWATGITEPDTQSPNYNDYNDFYNNTADMSASWPKGGNSAAVNPTFQKVANIRGTTATTSAQVLTDSGANFSSVTDNVDTFCITASTGGNTGCYLITSHTSTTITADSNIGSLGTGSAVTYAVRTGHNWTPSNTVVNKGMPGLFNGSSTTGYLTLGGVQKQPGFPKKGGGSR